MIARADDLASTARPLPLLRRPDIEAEPLVVRDRKWWRLKDPVALRFWQLGDEEHFLWSQLEAGVSLADLRQRFCERFAPRRIELPHLHQFLGALHGEGLIVSTAARQGDALLARHDRRQSRDRWSWMNLLSLRFRGLDPTRFLNRLYPFVAWTFRPWALCGCAVLVLSSLLLAAVESAQLIERLPRSADFLTPTNLIWLAFTLAGTKICHELGHALACRHLGGRCHELGVMLLVFTPCLYCNVSDSWMMPSRWRRMAISAAGICVELVLAAAATWLWWFSEPGLFSTVCLNVMVVCSINTLLFNGNPLLRYDGYFLLSDFLDLPNLRQAADEWLNQRMDRILFGIESAGEQPALRDRPGLVATYSLLAFAYRWFLTVIIWWIVYRWFHALRLDAIGIGIVLLSAIVIAGHSCWGSWTRVSTAWRARRVRAGRAAVSLIVILGLFGIACLVPFPRNVVAPGVIRPSDVATVYVTLPGSVLGTERPGRTVQAGEIVARLQNEDLEQEILQMTGELEVLRQQSESLRRRQLQQSGFQFGLTGVAGQLSTMEQQIASLTDRLMQKKSDQEQLTIRAPRSGTILPTRFVELEPGEELKSWQGSPLDERNVGGFLEAGTVVCQIGAPDRREAVIAVEQSQIDAVAVGQAVRIRLDELPASDLSGTVSGIAELRSEGVLPELIAKRLLPVSQETDPLQLVGTYYQVTVALDSGHPVPFGASGHARIRVSPQAIAVRIYNAICATFRW